MALARNLSNVLTALAFFAFATTAAAQAGPLFPLDHFWTHVLDAPFAAPPAADGRRVYVALQTGRLVAIEPGSKEPVWSVELAVDGPMTVANGRIYAPASGAIQALDAATGSVLWRLPASALAAPLTHRADWLIAGLADGGLQAVRATDGVVMWARALGSPLAAPVAVDGDTLGVVLADGRLAVMDVATGKARWEKTLGSPATGLTLDGDRIFTGTADGYFWSIKTRDGDLDWRWRRGARVVGSAVADADRVYVVALDNVVRGLSRGSGHEKWNHPLPTRPLSGPMLVDGVVVITSGLVGAPGLTYINAITGTASGKTPPLPQVDETSRTQYPVALSGGTPAFALIATATTSGDWQMHAYRQTFLTAISEPRVWGPLYEIRRRLDIATGAILWGATVTLTAPMGAAAPPKPPAVP